MKDSLPLRRHAFYLVFAGLAALQWPLLRAFGFHPPAELEALLPGLTILGAAFLLSWTAEAAEMDMPQGLSVVLLALIAVLPEYAVDIYFAWMAGKEPHYTAYAAANMTGSNRLLIGIGWASVLFACWLKHGRKEIRLSHQSSPELIALGLATLYALIIPLKSTLSFVDCAVFLTLFGVYAYRISKAHIEEPDLEGPALLIGALPTWRRRFAVAGFFLVSAASIFLAAEPFAEGLLASGRHWGISEFFLVQWLAPLASEAPEFIVAILFALRNKGETGLKILLASKVNQWTLLIGMLPAAFHLSSGSLSPMHLDGRQAHEIMLTAGQSLFALAILVNLSFSLREALLLALLFITQLFFPSYTGRNIYTTVYILGSIAWLAQSGTRRHIQEAWGHARKF